MKKRMIISPFLLFFILNLPMIQIYESKMEVKKETEKTSPSIDKIMNKEDSVTKQTSSLYFYPGAWITKSEENLARLQFYVNDNIVNGVVSTSDKRNNFTHASFTGMLHGNNIEGVFKDLSGEKGVITIKESGTQLVLSVALTEKKEKGIIEGEYKLKKEVTKNQ